MLQGAAVVECAAVCKDIKRSPLCALSNSALCTLHIGPRLVNILSDIEIMNAEFGMRNEGPAAHYKASQATVIRSVFWALQKSILDFSFFVLLRKSMKGGLCDKNVYRNRCVFTVFRFS